MLLDKHAANIINRQIAELVHQASFARKTHDIPEHLFSTDLIRLQRYLAR